jgi:hypothetical protein
MAPKGGLCGRPSLRLPDAVRFPVYQGNNRDVLHEIGADGGPARLDLNEINHLESSRPENPAK